MNCEEIRKKLNEYIDGELSKEETMDFEMHLYDCEDCKKLYMAYKELGEAVRETRSTDLPEDFQIAIPRENKVISLWKKYQKTAAVAAAALAIILIVRAVRDLPGFNVHETPQETAKTEEYTKPAEDLKADEKEEDTGADALTQGAKDGKVSESTQKDNKKASQDKKPSDKKEQDAAKKPAPEEKKEDVKSDTHTALENTEEITPAPNTQNAEAAESAETPSKPQITAKEEAAPEADLEAAEDTAAGGVSYNSYSASGGGGASLKSDGVSTSSKAAAPKSTVDLSPVLSYSMPSADSFANPDAYSALSSRLSSLKSRASSAPDGEKQAILNEFNSLRAEISYNLK